MGPLPARRRSPRRQRWRQHRYRSVPSLRWRHRRRRRATRRWAAALGVGRPPSTADPRHRMSRRRQTLCTAPLRRSGRQRTDAATRRRPRACVCPAAAVRWRAVRGLPIPAPPHRSRTRFAAGTGAVTAGGLRVARTRTARWRLRVRTTQGAAGRPATLPAPPLRCSTQGTRCRGATRTAVRWLRAVARRQGPLPALVALPPLPPAPRGKASRPSPRAGGSQVERRRLLGVACSCGQ